jgi:hypothetical protein
VYTKHSFIEIIKSCQQRILFPAIPIVNIPQNTYSVNIGNSVTLACIVSATPGETNVYWTKKIGNGAETTITKSDATKYQGQTVQAPGLIILNTDFNDIATYTCYATNGVGTGKSNPTNLQVIGSKSFIHSKICTCGHLY